jgi:hypothetical protein
MGFIALCGVFMLLKISWLDSITRLSYTGFDLGLVALALLIGLNLVLKLRRAP